MCVPSRLHRAKLLEPQQSAMMLRGAANHRQPILPQLLHSIEVRNFRDMGGRQSCRQQHLLGWLFQLPSLLEQTSLWPAIAGHIADSVAPDFAILNPKTSRRLDPVPHQTTAHYRKPRRPLAVKITNLIRTSPSALPNSSFPGPTGRALRRIGATSPLALPCEPCPARASLPSGTSTPAALRCCSPEARGLSNARSGAKSATDISG